MNQRENQNFNQTSNSDLHEEETSKLGVKKGFPCPFCKVSWKSYALFMAHLRKCSPSNMNAYHCPLCPARRSHRSDFLKHIREHHLDRCECKLYTGVSLTAVNKKITAQQDQREINLKRTMLSYPKKKSEQVAMRKKRENKADQKSTKRMKFEPPSPINLSGFEKWPENSSSKSILEQIMVTKFIENINLETAELKQEDDSKSLMPKEHENLLQISNLTKENLNQEGNTAASHNFFKISPSLSGYANDIFMSGPNLVENVNFSTNSQGCTVFAQIQNSTCATGVESDQPYIQIIKEGRYTRSIKAIDSNQKVYPHVDNVAPVIKRDNLNNYKPEASRKIVYEFEKEIIKTMAKFSENSEKFLMLTDSLFLGLKEDLFENCEVLNVEFPFMPSWLDRPKLRFHFENLFQEHSVPTVFYAMGFDLIRAYEYDDIQDVVNEMTMALTDFMNLMEGHSMAEKKEIVFITVPEIGILSDAIKEFNKRMIYEIVEINEEYNNRVFVKVLDYDSVIKEVQQAGILNKNHTLDDRIGEFVRELVKPYRVKLRQ